MSTRTEIQTSPGWCAQVERNGINWIIPVEITILPGGGEVTWCKYQQVLKGRTICGFSGKECKGADIDPTDPSVLFINTTLH